uniref:SRCR domain-containing protein n=1 Tax=Amphimedon queenslandica TaxID=400682 RepID=A0A1X7TKI1_AMPQE
ARVFSKSYFGHRSSGTHIMSSVYCSNSAASLLDCSYNSLSAITSCGDLNRAGVICLDACDDGNLRLSGSSAEYAGRVEICIESYWTSLCDQNWDLKDAQVACRELGYSPYGAMPTYGCYTEGQLSFGITSINCTGSENALLNCSHNNIERSNCSNGSIRLVDAAMRGISGWNIMKRKEMKTKDIRTFRT